MNVYVFDKLLDSHVTHRRIFRLSGNPKVHEFNLIQSNGLFVHLTSDQYCWLWCMFL